MEEVVSRKVLLVEDDRVSRESLAYLLRGLGHEVVAVWSAEEAKASLNTFTPEVALLDVRLPGLPGDAFAVYLRSKLPRIKIVFVSGEFHLQPNEDSGLTGADFIPKPLDFGRLIDAIQN